VKIPGPRIVRLVSAGAKLKAQRRYRAAKETKRRGRGDRMSECFLVPMKRNQPEGPHGEKGAPEHGNVRGKDGGDTGSITVSISDILQIGQRGAWPEVNHKVGCLAILIDSEVVDGG
jgi:hypothetical protein